MPRANPSTENLLDTCAASKLLGVHRKTLICWAKKNVIVGSRPNPNGKWFFDVSSTNLKFDYENGASSNSNGDGAIKAIYARVSTRKQLDDLQSQIRTLETKYPDHVVFSDCASGLNFKRKGLLSLLQLAFERRLRIVRVAHRDRLCRFAFDLLEFIFRVHGAQIIVEASDLPSSIERELAEDVLSVITVFGARLYGARSAGRRRRHINSSSSSKEEQAREQTA